MVSSSSSAEQPRGRERDGCSPNVARYRVHLREQNYGKALSDLNKALTARPDYEQGLLQRGKLFKMMGRCGEAAEDLRRYTRVKPDDATAQKLLPECTHCEAHTNAARQAARAAAAVLPVESAPICAASSAAASRAPQKALMRVSSTHDIAGQLISAD